MVTEQKRKRMFYSRNMDIETLTFPFFPIKELEGVKFDFFDSFSTYNS